MRTQQEEQPLKTDIEILTDLTLDKIKKGYETNESRNKRFYQWGGDLEDNFKGNYIGRQVKRIFES